MKNLMKVEDVIEYTGFTKPNLYYLVQHRKIPYCRPTGGRLFFVREDLEQWIMSSRKEVKNGK